MSYRYPSIQDCYVSKARQELKFYVNGTSKISLGEQQQQHAMAAKGNSVIASLMPKGEI